MARTAAAAFWSQIRVGVRDARRCLGLICAGLALLALTLPQQALAARAINVGDEVQATPEPYGIAFAHADTGQAFYLVLDDAWHRELAARVVTP